MEENALMIERIFDAPRQLVWDAWTKPELFQKWWGPEQWSAPDVNIEFRTGGTYHASMEGPMPDGSIIKVWSKGEYKEIVPIEKIVVSDYFSNEAGDKIRPDKAGMDPNFPEEMIVTITFEEVGEDKTKLTIIYPKPDSEAAVKAMMASGMKEGWEGSLEKLAKVLKEAKR
jgi:uncharacterized protein YndB with AHSA1/START domain